MEVVKRQGCFKKHIVDSEMLVESDYEFLAKQDDNAMILLRSKMVKTLDAVLKRDPKDCTNHERLTEPILWIVAPSL